MAKTTKTKTKKVAQKTTTEHMYDRYNVTIRFKDLGIAGGTPVDKGIANSHAAKYSAEVTNALQLAKENEGEVSEEAINKYLDQVTSVFPLDQKHGIFIRGFQIKAMLKDGGQRLKETRKLSGLGNTIRDGGVVLPQRIYLETSPQFSERPVKPDFAPANIKKFQVAPENPDESLILRIPVAVIQNGDLPAAKFTRIWMACQEIGLGANRHLGYGMFTLMSIEKDTPFDPPEGEFFEEGSANPVPNEVWGQTDHDKAVVARLTQEEDEE